MIHRSLVSVVLTLLLGLFVLAPVPASAFVLPEGVEQVTSVEGITEYSLPNGMRVLMFPDPSKPTVTVNITYMVGSRHEQYGDTGMAHLLEHLLFKDTPNFKDISGEMKKRGVSFNATTWLDRTNYFANFAAEESTLDWVLAMEAERMVASPLRREDLDSEMTVVRNEMESGENNPVRVLMSRIASVAHVWHNYGNSTIGARADVENMPIERLQAFYRTHYRPDNATLLVAGRIDPETTLPKIVATFGAIAQPETPIAVTYTREPTQDGEREVTVRRVGETRYLGMAYHGPSGLSDDYAPLALLINVLGDTPTGRLHKSLVEGGLATFVASIGFALAEPGYVMFLAEAPKEGDFDALQAGMLELVEQVAATPVTEQELADAKRRFATSTEQTVNDANRLAMSLSESIAQGDWRMFFLQRDRIEAASLDDVNRVAAHYFKPSNRTLGRFVPTAEPDRTEIAEARPVQELVADYVGREAVAAGEAFDPSPANIDSRVHSAKLANGTELRLLQKSTRGGTVVLNMSFRFGDEATLMGKSEAASMAASMLTRGSQQRSREDIARRLDELKAQLSISGDAQSVNVSANTVREHLPDVIDLIGELLQQPAFPEREFTQLRSQAITGIESQMTEPQAIGSNAMSRHFSPWPKGHPLYAATFQEQIDDLRALTLDEVRSFHAGFYGAGDGEIAVLGDFDTDALQAQLDERFGSWTRPQPFVRIASPYRSVATAAHVSETPDKANAIWFARADLPLSDSHPDYPALVVGNFVFGGGSLSSRLADRIRVKDGLSYGVGAQFNASALDERGSLMAYAIAAPENVEKVEAAFRDEVALLLENGVSEAEFKNAVDGLLIARARGRGEDPSLVRQLRSDAYLGRSMAWSAEFEDQLRALTLEQVNAAVRQHFGAVEFSLFRAGDFSK